MSQALHIDNRRVSLTLRVSVYTLDGSLEGQTIKNPEKQKYMLRDEQGKFKGRGVLRKVTHYVVIVLVVYLASMYAITLLTSAIYNYLYSPLFLV